MISLPGYFPDDQLEKNFLALNLNDDIYNEHCRTD